jgi:hypothetical protein
MTIEVEGRRYVVVGFDPMSVRPQTVELEDLTTHRRVAVTLEERPGGR